MHALIFPCELFNMALTPVIKIISYRNSSSKDLESQVETLL